MIEFAIAMVVLIAILMILQVVPLPEPFKRILMIVIGAVIVIYLLMWLAGVAGLASPPRLLR
jgi:hypothetical protein